MTLFERFAASDALMDVLVENDQTVTQWNICIKMRKYSSAGPQP